MLSVSGQLSREASVGGREPSPSQGPRSSPSPCTLLHDSLEASAAPCHLPEGSGAGLGEVQALAESSLYG